MNKNLSEHNTKSLLDKDNAADEPVRQSTGVADATTLYLKDIGFSSLLTAEEEIF